MNFAMNQLRSAARWLAVCALVFHIVWVPVHLATEAHCDSPAGHAQTHVQAACAHHGHGHDAGAGHEHEGDADHHHFTGDHEDTFLAKRQAIVCPPALVAALRVELTPPPVVRLAVVPEAQTAPPPADFSPPASPRAPPLG